jgi:cyclopropane fatty-acyl-phospholipid synthase-like methyltransferase
MKDIILSVVESLDGENPELFPYLPYILQDFTEIGADPEIMIGLVKKHLPNRFMKVVDLGCGKGAISVALANEFDCHITGIDALPDFVNSSKVYAAEMGVSEKCDFYTGDIRTKIFSLKGFDVVILGAIGNVLGNVGETLTKVHKIVNPDGYVLLDDGWQKTGIATSEQYFPTETEYFDMIHHAGFKVIEMVIANMDDYSNNESLMMEFMQRRCEELIAEKPGNKQLFDRFLKKQQREFDRMQNELTCATLLLQKLPKH